LAQIPYRLGHQLKALLPDGGLQTLEPRLPRDYRRPGHVPHVHLRGDGRPHGQAVEAVDPQSGKDGMDHVAAMVHAAGEEDRGGGQRQDVGTDLVGLPQPAQDQPRDRQVADADHGVERRAHLPGQATPPAACGRNVALIAGDIDRSGGRA